MHPSGHTFKPWDVLQTCKNSGAVANYVWQLAEQSDAGSMVND